MREPVTKICKRIVMCSRATALAWIFLAQAPASRAGDADGAFRAWSSVGTPGLQELAAGKIATATNASMGLARGLSAQAVYLLDAPADAAAKALLNFDSSKHPELNTFQYRIFQSEMDADFGALRLDSKARAISSLVQAVGDPGKIQLSKEEAARAPKDQTVEAARAFLAGVLRQRCNGLLQRGDLGGVRTFDSRGEIQSLLAEEPKISARFAALLAPLKTKTGIGAPACYYWSLSTVDKAGAISLGALYTASVGESRQVLDATFYSSGGYLASVTLYELLPVSVHGKPATLVWQGCLVSSTELAGGFGIKRKIASVMMAGDLEKSIRVLQREVRKFGN